MRILRCAAAKPAPACNNIVTFFPNTVQRQRGGFDDYRDQLPVFSRLGRWHRACSLPVKPALAMMMRTTVMLHLKVTALLLLLMCCAMLSVNYWWGHHA
jgi:hypothetical protein